MTKDWDTIVIGGGQAGLASGYHLQKKGLQFLILEADKEASGSWSKYYESLKLFSPARFSSLPGMNFPGNHNDYPSRNEVIKYLKDYIEHFKLPVMRKQQIVSVEKNDKVFTVHTSTGEKYYTKTIINATGSFQSPYTPLLKGHEIFKGRIIHSSEYRKPDTFINQRNVVVGRGNSAVQIAIELAEVSMTTLAVRQPVHLIKQRVLGQDIHFWLKVIGFDRFPFWRFGKTAPSSSSVIDLGQYSERLAQKKPDQQSMFTSFYTDGVIWSDGSKEAVDNVIFATGYQNNLAHLNELGATDSKGQPLHIGGISTTVQGLYYVGLEGQRSVSSATLRGVGPDAQYVIRKLVRYLNS
ncbi:flavin-containing monooxygenase [Ferdinandcohnia quinoae]|uniref:NAD(P)/FAD-dependent oxidoreductase n=1 Tax=Fredinandcohnia quinoae TaxID=2918902 RepID=A0AAW5EDA8_9BACI|nr:NAD(P)/FAD-dependent oxidoreductase [Fredinandcohnia sp. SECRCQ15]MCH1627431.1 NAD(P)/FAD-dependent oxidoreductase [Fredinandcohnia sp. SECRCQ15]